MPENITKRQSDPEVAGSDEKKKKKKKDKEKKRLSKGLEAVTVNEQGGALPNDVTAVRDAAAAGPAQGDVDKRGAGEGNAEASRASDAELEDTGDDIEPPGPGYVARALPTAFAGCDFDPNRHELWFMQLPHDWVFDETLTVRVQDDQGQGVFGTAHDQFSQGYTILSEGEDFAKRLYVVDPVEDGGGKKARALAVQRRLTVVREALVKEPPVATLELTSIPLGGQGNEAVAQDGIPLQGSAGKKRKKGKDKGEKKAKKARASA